MLAHSFIFTARCAYADMYPLMRSLNLHLPDFSQYACLHMPMLVCQWQDVLGIMRDPQYRALFAFLYPVGEKCNQLRGRIDI